MSIDLFVFAGETSGDVHGATILKRLREIHPKLKITAVAGPKMRDIGVDLFMPMENFQVMGYSAVFKRLPELIYQFKKTLNFILKEKPKAVLFIDFPGFNLRMAKALRKKDFQGKLIHYICPTVWAHGKNRVYTLSATLDSLLSIFPFEHKYFEETSLKPTYVGHPLIEQALFVAKPEDKLNLDTKSKEKPLIGIFPGSRTHEIKQNLPKILQSCEIFKSNNPQYLFVISVAEKKLETHIRKYIQQSNLLLDKDIVLLSSKENLHLMSKIDAAIATSGTITFELGVMKVPTAVVYHLSPFNAFVARHIIKIRMAYYCIVNIICNKHVFPELYYLDFVPQKVASTLHQLCQEGSYLRKNSIQGCLEMLKIMNSEKMPSVVVAKEISSLIYETTV
ncbi:MAG: Lipid-A-disaccharide synthase [Chlamydiae bacterium]|nr:Lipid-A-disaccharide synthase [Chlamydiota bacterium]